MTKTLAAHPISYGLSKYYEKHSAQQARYFAKVISDLNSMVKVCRWSPETEKTLNLYHILFVTDEQKYSFTPVKGLIEKCPQAIPLWSNVLLNMYYILPNPDEKTKQMLYDLIDELEKKGSAK